MESGLKQAASSLLGRWLYLTDRSATKVHQMAVDQRAHLYYDVEIGSGARLEYVLT
ncbi:MAG: hypothetical protein RBJ76_03875 [Stenomitos frigidus ULC029]